MDVILLGASACLTARLSRQIGHELSSRQRQSVMAALGLSLALLSMSVLEATPSSWLVVFDHDTSESVVNRNGFVGITAMYRFLLWILCIWIVVALPAIAGGQLMQHLTSLRPTADGDAKKDSAGVYSRRKRRWIRILTTGMMAVPLVLCRISKAICRKLYRSCLSSPADPVLIMTSPEQSSPRQVISSPRQRRPILNLVQRAYQIPSFLLGSVLGVICSLTFLHSIGKLVMQSSLQHTQLLPTMVSWLCAVGLLVSSALNGFGSVSMPHSCLAGFYLEPVRPEAVALVQVELEKTKTTRDSTRAELSSSTPREGGARRRSTNGMLRKAFVEYGEEAAHRKQVLQRDLEFLETLIAELEEELAEMKYAQAMAAGARTPLGKIRSWLGVVFSVILLVRLYTSISSIWKGLSAEWSASPSSTSRSDPITTALLWLTGHNFVSEQDYNALSQCVSLLLTAFLSISQIRIFLRTVSTIHRRLIRASRACFCTKNGQLPFLSGQGIESYVHLLSATLGSYFLSCIVLTKMNLPLVYRSGFSAALGGASFVIQSSVSNAVYASSAVASAIILGLLFGIQRQNTKRHVATVQDLHLRNNEDAC